MPPMIHAFSQNRASRITGLSVRQLEYWDATNVLKPSVAGHEVRNLPRLYSFTDLLRLSVAKQLRDHKMLPSTIRTMVDEFEHLGFDEPLLTLRFVSVRTADGKPSKRVFWINPRTEGVQDARAIGQVVEVFDLTLVEIKTGVEGKIAELTQRTPGQVTRIRGLRGRAAVIAGTRVPTAKIQTLSEAGWSEGRILASFPHLTGKDVQAAITYEERSRRVGRSARNAPTAATRSAMSLRCWARAPRTPTSSPMRGASRPSW